MSMEKVCEYLNEIGILDYDNINTFLNIYSKLSNQNNTSDMNKIIDTLKIYLNNYFIKNNQTSKLCQNIVYSYNTYQLISKFKSLNNMNNILLQKLRNIYIIFFLNLSLYMLKKKEKGKIIKQRNLGRKSKSKKNYFKSDKYDEEGNNINNNVNNTGLISSDDERECTFTPQINKNFKGYKRNDINNNVESHIYYSPAFNISSKFPINQYQNNIYTNQSFTDNNMNNYSFSNLNISNDNRSNMSYNRYGNNYNQFPEQQYNNEYNLNPNNRTYYSNNNRMVLPNYNNNNFNMNNQYPYNNKSNYSNISDINQKNADLFFNKELYFIQKVKDKIENMKIEELNKIKQECPFKPKINTNYKSFYPGKDLKEKEKSIDIKDKNTTIQIKYKNNLEDKKDLIKKEKRKRAHSEKKKGLKIIEDLSLAKKKRTEKTKRLMKEKNFTPKITKNDKYKVTMSFEDRRLKSIELRNKYKKAKKPENGNMDIQNNAEGILAPGEMVRFKENNNVQNNFIDNLDNNNINTNINENNDHDLSNKINISKEIDNNKVNNENLIESKENNNKYLHDEKENNEKEIEKNKQFLMDKIKGEHKIGFKSKKDEENKDIKLTEENNDSEIKNDLDINSAFSVQNFEAKSKSLKNILKKNDE